MITHIKFLTLLGLVISLAHAGHIKNEDPSSTYIDQCLSMILHSPLTKQAYPELLGQRNNPHAFQFLGEIDLYCTCRGQVMFKRSQRNALQLAFENPSLHFSKLDQCAQEHLSQKHLSLLYQHDLAHRLIVLLRSQLEGRRLGAIRTLASQDSLKEHDLCVQDKILNKCTKIQSLSLTYQCMRKQILDTRSMNKIQRSCPLLKYPQDPRYKSPSHYQNMI